MPVLLKLMFLETLCSRVDGVEEIQYEMTRIKTKSKFITLFCLLDF